MKTIENQILEGERALFMSRDLKAYKCTFQNGESPLKESKNIEVLESSFGWKYPLWYCENVVVNNTLFKTMSRSGIWYTKNIELNNCTVEAPKEFRRASNIRINNCRFTDAAETLWSCDDITIKDSYFSGDYLLMNSTNVKLYNMTLDGNYVLDGAKNVEVENCILNTKDAFWNCENVVVKNSTIIGEYFGWNSKNVTLINCKIESNQGFCYMENLKIENCEITNTSLAFEYSTVDATITTRVDSIKNPISGKIVCKGYDELILDDDNINHDDTKIIVEE